MNPWDRRDKLGEIRSIARELRTDADATDAPDFAAAILGRVDAERPFLNRATRRALWLGRGMIAGVIAIGAIGVFIAYRYAPDTMDLSGRAAPLSAVVDRVQTQAASRVVGFQESIQNAPQSFARMVEPFDTSNRIREKPDGFNGPMIPPLEAACREMPSQCVVGSMMLSDWSERVAGTVSAGAPGAPGVGPTLVLSARRLAAQPQTSDLSRFRGELASHSALGATPGLTPMSEIESGVAPR